MSDTLLRDQVCELAKRDIKKALQKADTIRDPWFRAQALSWIARFTNDDPRAIAKQAAKAAQSCDDAYKQTAVRAWEIAALAERKFVFEARKTLLTALQHSTTIAPLSSRSEALIKLLQASLTISIVDAKVVNDELQRSCGKDSHWRCKRAVRDAAKMVSGELKPRSFF